MKFTATISGYLQTLALFPRKNEIVRFKICLPQTTPIQGRLTLKNFLQLGVPEDVISVLNREGIVSPTPIQQSSIPLILEGRDLLASANTGTGKTLAFSLPMLLLISKSSRDLGLVLTPTRELAAQIAENIAKLAQVIPSANKTALLIGGEPISKQIKQIKKGPRIIIGTPGRIIDHLESGNLMLNTVARLVLDETDRMLDMGFSDQLEKILKYLSSNRQTLLFSATIPASIAKISKKYLKTPERISLQTSVTKTTNIDQQVVYVSKEKKFDALKEQLDLREGSIVVFVGTKFGADRVAEKVKGAGFRASAIHGDMRQNMRTRILENFRKQKIRILIATDVASRGIDVHHIEHVINYDLPQCPEDYVHRIGRTGRAGAKGSALCFITKSDQKKWDAIDKICKIGSFSSHGGSADGVTKKSNRSKASNPNFKKYNGGSADGVTKKSNRSKTSNPNFKKYSKKKSALEKPAKTNVRKKVNKKSYQGRTKSSARGVLLTAA